MFKRNEHTVERVIRVIVGIALLSQAVTGQQNPWFFLGIVPLITGLVGICPVYTLLGINTCGACCTSGNCKTEEKKS